MPKAWLLRLFWEALDGLAYAVMDMRLWLFDLMHDPEPLTPDDEKREADRDRLEALPVIDFAAFMAAADEPAGHEVQLTVTTPLTASGAWPPGFSPPAHRPAA